ncbi:unnamed protein product [Paramecium sonneborni]|uniref:3'-5' exonuclease domain-containing protein n=1 Tax=Paramecium sonneborni TaxID=65129 RepID=A0A8S1LWT5_9CILI|nr:unnamed protein product [Paramecium sonneborni]
MDQENKLLFEQNLQKILEGSIQNNVQKVFIRVLFEYLKKNKDQINIKQLQDSGIVKIWKNFQFQEMSEFIEIFQLKDQFTEYEIQFHLEDFIKKKKFEEAFQFYKALKLPQIYFDNLVNQMAYQNKARKAADFIKQLDYDPANNPKIIERLEKNCIRYLSKEYPWFKCEEMLLFNPSLLIYYCEDLYYHGKKNRSTFNNKKKQLINLNQETKFKGKYAKGFLRRIPKNQIIIIDQIDQYYFDAWKSINQSEVVGYDCENVTPWTKLESNSIQVCLIQIATQNRAFLFDDQKLKNIQEFKDDIKQLLENVDIQKIDQNLKDDLSKQQIT